jgi:hypothetical protein
MISAGVPRLAQQHDDARITAMALAAGDSTPVVAR